MDNTTKTKNRPISSLAAPSAADLAIWQEMTDSEKRALVQAKADEAAASKYRFMSADDIIKEAQAELNHG